VRYSGPGNGPTSGGTTITVHGAGFVALAECGVTVAVGNTATSPTTWVSSEQVVARVAAGVSSVGQSVRVRIGQLQSNVATFAKVGRDIDSTFRCLFTKLLCMWVSPSMHTCMFVSKAR